MCGSHEQGTKFYSHFSSGLKPELLLLLAIPVLKLLGLVVGHQGGLRMQFERLDHEGWFGEWEKGKSAGITEQLTFLLSQAPCFIKPFMNLL